MSVASLALWVATEVFDDTDLPIGNRIDTFLGLTNRIVKFLENLLEDGRIERVLGEQKPGLANFLKAS